MHFLAWYHLWKRSRDIPKLHSELPNHHSWFMVAKSKHDPQSKVRRPSFCLFLLPAHTPSVFPSRSFSLPPCLNRSCSAFATGGGRAVRWDAALRWHRQPNSVSLEAPFPEAGWQGETLGDMTHPHGLGSLTLQTGRFRLPGKEMLPECTFLIFSREREQAKTKVSHRVGSAQSHKCQGWGRIITENTWQQLYHPCRSCSDVIQWCPSTSSNTLQLFSVGGWFLLTLRSSKSSQYLGINPRTSAEFIY